MIIVGSGPAGLTAAYLLAKRGHKVTVIEQSSQTGGQWRGYGSGFSYIEQGMRWYTICGIDEIDEFWENLLPCHLIPRTIAGCFFNGKLQTNSPYPDLRGLNVAPSTAVGPILEKLWKQPVHQLAGNAGDIVNINRCVLVDELTLTEAYKTSPIARKNIAWPDQRTMPEEYRSSAYSFYPSEGMGDLVDDAVTILMEMGVTFKIGHSLRYREEMDVIWAAGIRSAASVLNLPYYMHTKPRSITAVEVDMADEAAPHDLHYAYDYDPGPLFRVTWYKNFVERGTRVHRVGFEFLDTPTADVPGALTAALEKMGTDVPAMFRACRDLGPVLPVPTIQNEKTLEAIRADINRFRGFRLVGAGAERGMFYQPDVLQHVHKAVSSVGKS